MKSLDGELESGPQRVAIIGTGLLGGSFGLACRQRWPGAQVTGLARSSSSRDQALACGAVTHVTDNLQQACEDADWVIVATPVEQIASIVIESAEFLERDPAVRSGERSPLIMDLGSTKGSIVREIDKHPVASQWFVGAHPIAGSEKTGAAHARANLFQQRVVVLTPSSCTAEPKLRQAAAVWRTLQSTVIQMTPESHDEALACVSHLPHLMASMLAGLLPPSMHPLVGTGWLDTTRVASGDPGLWTSICRENRTAILSQLNAAKHWIEKFAEHLQGEQFDQVQQLLSEAKSTRDLIQQQRR